MHGGPLTGLVRLDVAQAVARDARHRREVDEVEGVVGEERLVGLWRESCCAEGLLGDIAVHDESRLRLGVAHLLEPLDDLLGDVGPSRVDLQLQPVGRLRPPEAERLAASVHTAMASPSSSAAGSTGR